MFSISSRHSRGDNSGARRWARKSESAKSLITPLNFEQSNDDEYRNQAGLESWMKVEVKSLEEEKLAS